MVMLVVMAAGAMMLSAFTTPKQAVKVECSVTEMNGENWVVARQNVPYCTEDDRCAGYGTLWYNEDNGQFAFSKGSSSTNTKYALAYSTKVDGYNYRFWNSNDGCYYYINITA